MAIKAEESKLVGKWFPGGSLTGISGYYAQIKKDSDGTRTPKTEFISLRPIIKIDTLEDFHKVLLDLMDKSASRVELQMLDRANKRDFCEFHIERLLPAELLPVGFEKDFKDFIEMVKEMRQAQREPKFCEFNSVLISNLEAAVDLKITEMEAPARNKNQISIFQK
jgi:hypothetical protein